MWYSIVSVPDYCHFPYLDNSMHGRPTDVSGISTALCEEPSVLVANAV